MKELTWQLVRGKGPSSWLIGFQGSGYYSHIDVLTPAGMLRGARSDWIGNVPPGYDDRPYGYEQWRTQTQYTVTVTDAQWAAYWAFSDAQLGKPYDKRGLVESFVLGRNWRDDDAWWCSEEVAVNMEKALIIPPLPSYIINVEPGDCAFLFMGLAAKVNDIGAGNTII